MTHTSSCFLPPFLTEKPQNSQRRAHRVPRAHPLAWREDPQQVGWPCKTEEGGQWPQHKRAGRPRSCSGLTRLPVLAPRPAGLLLLQLAFPSLGLGRLLLPVLVLLQGRPRVCDPSPWSLGTCLSRPQRARGCGTPPWFGL